MKQFGKLMLVTLGFGVLGFLMSLFPHKGAGGLPVATNVNVVNTPLPVGGNVTATISGTPTVNVASLPPLNFPGNVGISGPVSVQNLGSGSGAPIPIVTQDSDEAARKSFAASGTCNWAGNQCTISPIYAVPTGQIAVIDSVSGACGVRTGTSLLAVDVNFIAPVNPSSPQQLFLNDVLIIPGPEVAAFGHQVITFAGAQKFYAWSSPFIVPSAINVTIISPDDQTNNGSNCSPVSVVGHLVSQ